MFFFKRKKLDDDKTIVLGQMDGRQVKYVTERARDQNGSVKEKILGKEGRIVVIDGEIRVMCGETDVFRCNAEQSNYYTLLSGDGITVSGVNTLDGRQMDIIVYYTYYRK